MCSIEITKYVIFSLVCNLIKTETMELHWNMVDRFNKILQCNTKSGVLMPTHDVVMYISDYDDYGKRAVSNVYVSSNLHQFICKKQKKHVFLAELSKDSSVLSYLVTSNKTLDDCFWMFMNTDENKEKIVSLDLTYNSKIYLIGPVSPENYTIIKEIYSVVKSDGNAIENTVEIWENCERIFHAPDIWKRRRNLRHHHFRIFSMHSPPFVNQLENGELEGLSIDIVKLLQIAMNFTYNFTILNDEPFGVKLENGSFNGIVKLLQDGNVDFAAAMLQANDERSGKF